jgi:hypothetical protein
MPLCQQESIRTCLVDFIVPGLHSTTTDRFSFIVYSVSLFTDVKEQSLINFFVIDFSLI